MIGPEYHRNYYKKRIEELKQLLGGRCRICGATENLEFDHTDRSTKRFNIAKIAKRSKESVMEELSKCELLCRRCHIEKSQLELFKLYKSKAKSVAAYDPKTGKLVKTYRSLSAARNDGFNFDCVQMCCKGTRRTHKGYAWRFVDKT